MCSRRSVVAFLVLSTLTVSSLAQDPATDDEASPKPEIEETIVVTASRHQENLLDAPVAITVLDAETLASSPALDFAELLRPIPGLNVIQLSARDINVTSRGATGVVANTQLVLLDGRPLNSSFFGNVAWDFFPMSEAEIERIEVIRGPASAVWGAGAMSGVLNVVTKSPRARRGTRVELGLGGFERPDGEEGGIGSFDLGHARVASDRLAYQFSLGVYAHDAFARPTGTLPNGTGTPYPPYENRDTLQPSVNFKLEYGPGEDSLVTVGGGFAGTEGIFITPAGPFEQTSDNSLSYVQVDYSRRATLARFYANVYDSIETSLLSRGPDGAPIESSFEAQSYELELSHSLLAGERHFLTFGGNLSYDAFDLALAPLGTERDDQGLFVEDEISLSERFQAVVGARVDRFSVLEDPVLSPRLVLLFQPDESHSLRLSYNRGYRAPTLFDNYIDFEIVGELDLGAFDPRLAGVTFPFVTSVVGSLELEEVSLTSYEIGYSANLGRWASLNAAYYFTETEDEIIAPATPYTSANPPLGWPLPPFLLDVLVQAGGGLPAVIGRQNSGRVDNQGIELGLDLRFEDGVRAFFSYSWQDEPEVRDFDASLLNKPAEHRASVGVEVHRERFDGSLSVAYTGEAFWADVLDSRFHGTTDAFTTVNLSLGWWWRGRSLLTALKVTNLTGEEIQQHIFGDVLGRQAILEARLSW